MYKQLISRGMAALCALFASLPAAAQSFMVQCPNFTNLHPDPSSPGAIAAIAGASTAAGRSLGYADVFPGAVKCQHVSGGDGYATMADGSQIYLFGFGPLSGLADIGSGLPGTEPAAVFNSPYVGPVSPGDATPPNNAAVSEPAQIMNTGVMFANEPGPLMAIDEDDEFFLTLSNVGMIMRPDLFEQHTIHFHGYPNASSFFDGVPDASVAINIAGSFTYYYTAPDAGTYFWHCHITPPEHLQMGMVGQLYVRPRQDRLNPGDPLLPLAAAHACAAGDILCSAPLPAATTTDAAGNTYSAATATRAPATVKYAYNDADGSTRYDVEYPIQLMGFDPNFHFVGMTFNPEPFVNMKDKYFLMNGRGYPDTAAAAPMSTAASDGVARPSQPVPTLIVINKTAGQTRALLRISELNVTEFHTLATVGIPMEVIGWNARLLRDEAGNNLYYDTNSITLGGGESADVILDAANVPLGTYFLYTTNLDHLSNDAENYGGMMTEIRIE